MKDTDRHFGERLQVIRGGRGISQRELARKIGADASYISRLESGERDNPTISTVRRLADALDVSVGTLIEGGS